VIVTARWLGRPTLLVRAVDGILGTHSLPLAQQLIRQLLINQRRPGRRIAITLAGTIEVSVITCHLHSR
jgi:hypothetical protein